MSIFLKNIQNNVFVVHKFCDRSLLPLFGGYPSLCREVERRITCSVGPTLSNCSHRIIPITSPWRMIQS